MYKLFCAQLGGNLQSIYQRKNVTKHYTSQFLTTATPTPTEYIYNTVRYLINICVPGGNIYFRCLFSNNVIYEVCSYAHHQTCDKRLLPSSCLSVCSCTQNN